jgi:hypothetical protein
VPTVYRATLCQYHGVCVTVNSGTSSTSLAHFLSLISVVCCVQLRVVVYTEGSKGIVCASSVRFIQISFSGPLVLTRYSTRICDGAVQVGTLICYYCCLLLLLQECIIFCYLLYSTRSHWYCRKTAVAVGLLRCVRWSLVICDIREKSSRCCCCLWCVLLKLEMRRIEPHRCGCAVRRSVVGRVAMFCINNKKLM